MADDEADASKIKKAEKRSAAKPKTLQEKKKKSGTKCSFSAHSPNSASRFGGASGSFPPAGSYFRPQGRNIFRETFSEAPICVFDAEREVTWQVLAPPKIKSRCQDSKCNVSTFLSVL